MPDNQIVMTSTDLLYVLALQRAPKIGDITAKKLIAHCGSARAVFEERPDRLRKIHGIGTYVTDNLRKAANLRDAERELRFVKDNGVGWWYFEDSDYPEGLRHCVDGPVLVFRSGAIDLKKKRMVSVVGTRRITTYGKYHCERLIAELAPWDPVIVSGFAYGVDITAQRAAISGGLQTVGCLAHGLNRMYPAAHKQYVKQVELHGGFLTDFWSDQGPDRENFLRRNRIIAGLSEATIVIESAEKGGGLVTADIAHSYDRDVFALPGRIGDKYSAGCNDLIKSQKAHMFTSVEDLVYVLGWHRDVDLPGKGSTGQEGVRVVQPRLFPDMDDTEKKIYGFLSERGKELLDSIALHCEMPVYKVSSALLTMEMKGVVRPLPGKLFEAVIS
ncbi:DNA processing protein [Sinomicrobium oceani]|uniref:DNA processing protein n=2 Tax=Sinomicrobium oceani TaxID=1150368 RepID=A0A1K1P4S2_9FLAO|nr:DNA processing protein [Sinomicrobium oceani]